jgi:hypothetical protein
VLCRIGFTFAEPEQMEEIVMMKDTRSRSRLAAGIAALALFITGCESSSDVGTGLPDENVGTGLPNNNVGTGLPNNNVGTGLPNEPAPINGETEPAPIISGSEPATPPEPAE